MVHNNNVAENRSNSNFFSRLKHYHNCFSRWKTYILLTIPVLLLMWSVLLTQYFKNQPEVNHNIFMGIHQKSEYYITPVHIEDDLGAFNLAQSRNFLKKIVDSLGLAFEIPDIPRSKIISHVRVDSSASAGTYIFSTGNSIHKSFNILMSTGKSGRPKIVAEGSLDSVGVEFPGVVIIFSESFCKKPHSFKFRINSRKGTVEVLKNSIYIKGNKPNDQIKQGVIEIGLTGKDSELNSRTINLIADMLMDENVRITKGKNIETIDALMKQLQTATKQVVKNEDSIRTFRDRNPDISLNDNIHNIVSRLPPIDNSIFESNKKLQQAINLKKRMTSFSNEEKAQITIETLFFLGNEGIPGAVGLQNYYNYLLEQKFALETNEYGQGHRLVKENNKKIDQVNTKTDALLALYIKSINEEIYNNNSQRKSALLQLRQLPEKELHYASLLRLQLVNSEIYSELLSRYNQAKITNEAVISNMYVLDYSVPSKSVLDVKTLVKFLTAGIILSILISLGPAFVYDIFDKKPRNKDDLYRFFAYRILEEIPSTPDYKFKNNIVKISDEYSGEKFDTFEKTHFYQVYNKIYAKISSYLESEKSKTLLITSYSSNEGSSIVAASLAIIAAQKYKPTLLIDCDICQGNVCQYFGCTKKPGFSDLLSNELQVTEYGLNEKIQQTSFPELYMLSSGSLTEHPTDLFFKNQIKDLFSVALKNFNMVIINSPPLSIVPDAYLTSREIDSCIIVIKSGKTDSVRLNNLINEYPFLKEKILGIILADSPKNTSGNRKLMFEYTNKNNSEKMKTLS